MKIAHVYGAEYLSGDGFFGSATEYWKKKRYKMEHHQLVGKYAIVTVPDSTIYKRKLKVIRADDDQIIFQLSNVGELIINKDRYGNWSDVSELEWCE